MKVLLVGTDAKHVIEYQYLDSLKALDVDVSLYPAHSIFYDHIRNPLNAALFKLGLSPLYRKINSDLRKKIIDQKPDVIWVFKGMEIFPETLKWIRQRGIKIVNYNPDNPFLFSGRGSGNQNVIDGLRFYDLHFTYAEDIKARLESDFNVGAALLPFGFNVPMESYVLCEEETEMMRVCFVGNPDKDRVLFLEELARRGVEIDVFGIGWQKLDSSKNITVHQAIFGNEFWGVLRRYRVQLNLMRLHNENSHNMRTFEVPGVGGIMLAPYTPEHWRLFKDGSEAFFFSSVEECVAKIDMLLRLPLQTAKSIREAARERSLTSGYTYGDRARFVKQTFEQLIHG